MPEISERELGRLKQSLAELKTLNQISSAINVSMSLDEITSTITDRCCRRTKAEQGAIFLLEDEEDTSERFKTLVRETTSEDSMLPFHLNLSLQGWMLKNRAILVSNDPASDDRLRGVDFNKIGLKSLLAAPLMSRRGMIGVLAMFNKTGDTGFEEDDKRFLGIVSSQVAKVIENARLFDKEQKLAVIEKEMIVAKKIQQGFLPPSNVANDDYEVFGSNFSAKEVGGDYFDIIELDPDRVFFSLGDVSGKGLPAALLTGNAQAVLRSQLHRASQTDLTELADCLNQLICQFTSPEQYITATFGILDVPNRKITYVNAGHLPPMIVRNSGQIEMPAEADLVIGVLPDVTYHVLEVELAKGESFYIYTDGVTEAFDESQEQFGEDRLVRYLQNVNGQSVAAVCDELQEELRRYRGSAEQSDDITVLAIKVH